MNPALPKKKEFNNLRKGGVKIIVVSGQGSGVGKTYIAQKLLRCLKRWGALKITVSKQRCPHNKNCGICAGIKDSFSLIKDRKTINQPGKDTARLKAAGARKVLWLKAKPEGLKKGLSSALSEFVGCEGVIIEGTSVLKVIKPYLNIHVLARGNYKIIRAH